MNMLAFEASDFGLSIALMKRGILVESFASDDLYGQDAALFPVIDQMLSNHHLAYQDLDLIATTRGPGSFTGIRMALAAAEGLSLASNVPSVAFLSLNWVAESYIPPKGTESILVALESRRKDVYCQLFNNHSEPLEEAAALLPENLSLYLNKVKNVVCVGSGCYKLKTEELQQTLQFPEFSMPRAQDLCAYAADKVRTFGAKLFPCAPFYLRLPDVT
jgi:tRNA threonylcarbamoyladenosine biosynthesis protein TsaB